MREGHLSFWLWFSAKLRNLTTRGWDDGYQHDENAGGSRFTLPTAGSGTDTISGALFTNEDVFDVNAALDATKLDQQRRH